jgi:putative tricarboxylic transport membrane protein
VRGATAPLLGFGLAVALFVSTRGLDAVARAQQLGPGFWPRLVLVGLAVACLFKALAEWRRAGRAVEPAAAPAAIDATRLAEGIALIVLYVLVTPWAGFALTTVAFIAAFMVLAGARSPVSVGANALLGTVLLLYAFVKLVYLPLPKGAGGFEAFTLLVYRALRIF